MVYISSEKLQACSRFHRATQNSTQLKAGLFLELLVFSLSGWPQVNEAMERKTRGLELWNSWSPNYLLFISENRIVWLADSLYQIDGLKHGDPIFRDESLKT